MATLYKHGPLKGIYRPKGWAPNSDKGPRLALFENGTVLRRMRPGGAWEMTRFNTARLLAGASLLVEDLSPEAKAIFTRTNGASHAHEQVKKRRVAERRIAQAIGTAKAEAARS